jgi:hypothetical protein
LTGVVGCVPLSFFKELPMAMPDEPGRDDAPPRCEQLSSTAGTVLAGRFHVWKGRSGRRYVVSAYAPDCVPDYADVVMLAVRRTPEGPRLIAGAVREDAGADDELRAPEADEVHLHLLATDAAARAAVLGDLIPPA